MGRSTYVKDLQLNALGCEAESCQHEIRHILAEVEVDTTEIHLHRETRSDMCLSILPTRAATPVQTITEQARLDHPASRKACVHVKGSHKLSEHLPLQPSESKQKYHM
jgi:hypothetical protein